MSEHALIIYIPISIEPVGTQAEQNMLGRLMEELSNKIDSTGLGEYDGFEFGESQCTIYMYAPDADKLYISVKTVLDATNLPPGTKIIKRYGAAQDPSVRIEELIVGAAKN